MLHLSACVKTIGANKAVHSFTFLKPLHSFQARLARVHLDFPHISRSDMSTFKALADSQIGDWRPNHHLWRGLCSLGPVVNTELKRERVDDIFELVESEDGRGLPPLTYANNPTAYTQF
jgi:hypothetical protein